MAKSRAQKEALVAELVEKLDQLESAVFVSYHGLKVSEVEELRNRLHEAGVDYHVVKNTLFHIALRESKVDLEMDPFAGGVAVALGYDDVVAPAKILAEFAKEHEALSVLNGILDGAVIDKEKVEALAKLPSKEELIGRVVGSINAPVSNFVGVLRAQVSSVIYVLNAVAEQKKATA